MEISFTNRKLAKVCCSAKEMQAKHGKRMAEKIQQRFAELQAAETLADMRDLPGARCHELTGNLAGNLAVDLVHPDRLVFSPAHVTDGLLLRFRSQTRKSLDCLTSSNTSITF